MIESNNLPMETSIDYVSVLGIIWNYSTISRRLNNKKSAKILPLFWSYEIQMDAFWGKVTQQTRVYVRLKINAILKLLGIFQRNKKLLINIIIFTIINKSIAINHCIVIHIIQNKCTVVASRQVFAKSQITFKLATKNIHA